MSYDIISFDLDGTLVKLDLVKKFWFEEVPKLYAEKKGIDFEEAVVFVKNKYDELGPEDIRWYKPQYWFERFGLGTNPSEIIENIGHTVRYFPDALDLLERINSKHELIVISNAHRMFLNVQLEEISDYFSRTISCVSEFDRVKKDSVIYEKICDEIGVEPRNLVHVGDDEKFDYEIPREIGITSFLVDRDGGRVESDFVIRDLRKVLERI